MAALDFLVKENRCEFEFECASFKLELPLPESFRSKKVLRSNQSYSASLDSQNDSGGKSGSALTTAAAASSEVTSSSAASLSSSVVSSASVVSQAILLSLPPPAQAETRFSRSTGGIADFDEREGEMVWFREREREE